MTDLRKAAAAVLGISADDIHTAIVVGDELVVLTSALAKYRLPLVELPDVESIAKAQTDKATTYKTRRNARG